MEVRYLVEKWNIYNAKIFTRSLVQTCSLESTSLCLQTRLRVNKKFQNILFFLINANIWLLCVLLLMTILILHSRTPKTIKCLLFTWFLCFSWFFFRIFSSLKDVIHIAPCRRTRYVLKSFRYLEVRNRVRNWNKVKKLHIHGVENSIMPIGNTNIHIQNNVQNTLINSVSFLFCEFIRLTSWNDGKTIILVRSSFQIPK